MSFEQKRKISVFLSVIYVSFWSFTFCSSLIPGKLKNLDDFTYEQNTPNADRGVGNDPQVDATDKTEHFGGRVLLRRVPRPTFAKYFTSEPSDLSSALPVKVAYPSLPQTVKNDENLASNSTELHAFWTRGSVSVRKSSSDIDVGYQADEGFDGYDVQQGKVSGPAAETDHHYSAWLAMRPMVQCGGSVMTLTATGRGYTHLLVDRVDASPISLFQLPPSCGYSVRTTWRELEMDAPYDGCYITQENGNYVLHMLWWGSPVKMICPVQPPPPVQPPSVLCYHYGMALHVQEGPDAIPTLRARVNGELAPLVSDECAYRVRSPPEELVLFAPFTAPCVTTRNEVQLLLLLDEMEVTISCPLYPSLSPYPQGPYYPPPTPVPTTSAPPTTTQTTPAPTTQAPPTTTQTKTQPPKHPAGPIYPPGPYPNPGYYYNPFNPSVPIYYPPPTPATTTQTTPPTTTQTTPPTTTKTPPTQPPKYPSGPYYPQGPYYPPVPIHYPPPTPETTTPAPPTTTQTTPPTTTQPPKHPAGPIYPPGPYPNPGYYYNPFNPSVPIYYPPAPPTTTQTTPPTTTKTKTPWTQPPKHPSTIQTPPSTTTKTKTPPTQPPKHPSTIQTTPSTTTKTPPTQPPKHPSGPYYTQSPYYPPVPIYPPPTPPTTTPPTTTQTKPPPTQPPKHPAGPIYPPGQYPNPGYYYNPFNPSVPIYYPPTPPTTTQTTPPTTTQTTPPTTTKTPPTQPPKYPSGPYYPQGPYYPPGPIYYPPPTPETTTPALTTQTTPPNTTQPPKHPAGPIYPPGPYPNPGYYYNPFNPSVPIYYPPTPPTTTQTTPPTTTQAPPTTTKTKTPWTQPPKHPSTIQTTPSTTTQTKPPPTQPPKHPSGPYYPQGPYYPPGPIYYPPPTPETTTPAPPTTIQTTPPTTTQTKPPPTQPPKYPSGSYYPQGPYYPPGPIYYPPPTPETTTPAPPTTTQTTQLTTTQTTPPPTQPPKYPSGQYYPQGPYYPPGPIYYPPPTPETTTPAPPTTTQTTQLTTTQTTPPPTQPPKYPSGQYYPQGPYYPPGPIYYPPPTPETTTPAPPTTTQTTQLTTTQTKPPPTQPPKYPSGSYYPQGPYYPPGPIYYPPPTPETTTPAPPTTTQTTQLTTTQTKPPPTQPPKYPSGPYYPQGPYYPPGPIYYPLPTPETTTPAPPTTTQTTPPTTTQTKPPPTQPPKHPAGPYPNPGYYYNPFNPSVPIYYPPPTSAPGTQSPPPTTQSTELPSMPSVGPHGPSHPVTCPPFPHTICGYYPVPVHPTGQPSPPVTATSAPTSSEPDFPVPDTGVDSSQSSLQCLAGQVMVTLPSALPDSIHVVDQNHLSTSISSVPAACGYLLQNDKEVLTLVSPLPACHSYSVSPTTLSLRLWFWDLLLERYRTLELQCPHTSAPEIQPTTIQPPQTDPTKIQPPTTSPTKIQPPKTDPTTTQPPTTSPTKTKPPKTDPTKTQPPKTQTHPISPLTPPKPRVLCSAQQMVVELPPGLISGIVVKDIKGNQMRLAEAPKHCGYSVSQEKDGRITLNLPFKSCHMTVQDKNHRINVVYPTLSGWRGEFQLFCPTTIPAPRRECHSIPEGQRLPCGSGTFSQKEWCLSLGCCFSPQTATCYYPMDECTLDRHFVFSIPANLTDPHLSPAALVAAGDHACTPQRVTSDYAVFKIPLEDCGTRRYEVGQTVVYLVEIVNRVQAISLNYGTITRDSPLRLMVECRYSPGSVVSAGYLVKSPSLGPSIQAHGVTGVQLRIAHDAHYSSYYPQYHRPLQMLLGKPLYLEVRLVDPPDSSVVLLVHYCVAYPRSGDAAWILLFNGCPNPLDLVPGQQQKPPAIIGTTPLPQKPPAPALLHPAPARSQIRRFTISTFQFLLDDKVTDLQEEIYFMCSTEVCSPTDGPCVEGCFGH